MGAPSISGADVQRAAARIDGRVLRTPVAEIEPGALWFKLEQMQHTGSFKARGAFNRILAAAERAELTSAGVITASGGNAGMAVAHAARALGIPAEVHVPRTAPQVKVAKLRELGATVVQTGDKYADAWESATKRATDTGALICHAYDQPEICAGQGTLGRELLEQADVDTIMVAVGGGGLMAGIATAAEGRARVVAVEPERAPTLHAALKAGRPVDVPVSGIAADSLGASRAGDIAHEVAVRTGVVSVLVSDDDIVAARRALWTAHRLLVEHGAATAYAALRAGAYRPAEGERVAVVLCGANTDPADL